MGKMKMCNSLFFFFIETDVITTNYRRVTLVNCAVLFSLFVGVSPFVLSSLSLTGGRRFSWGSLAAPPPGCFDKEEL